MSNGFAGAAMRTGLAQLIMLNTTPAFVEGTDFVASLHTTVLEKDGPSEGEVSVGGYARVTVPRSILTVTGGVGTSNAELAFPAFGAQVTGIKALVFSDPTTGVAMFQFVFASDLTVPSGAQAIFAAGSIQVTMSGLASDGGIAAPSVRQALLAYLCGGSRPAFLDDTSVKLWAGTSSVANGDETSADFNTAYGFIEVPKSEFALSGGYIVNSNAINWPVLGAVAQSTLVRVACCRPGAGNTTIVHVYQHANLTINPNNQLVAPAGVLRFMPAVTA